MRSGTMNFYFSVSCICTKSDKKKKVSDSQQSLEKCLGNSFARFDSMAPWLLKQYKAQNPAVYLIPLCLAIWDSNFFHVKGMSPSILET